MCCDLGLTTLFVGGSNLFWEPGETFGMHTKNKKVSLPFFLEDAAGGVGY
jgi:hypothetical protein